MATGWTVKEPVLTCHCMQIFHFFPRCPHQRRPLRTRKNEADIFHRHETERNLSIRHSADVPWPPNCQRNIEMGPSPPGGTCLEKKSSWRGGVGGGAEWRATISFKKWRGLPTRNWDTAAVESATWFTIPPTVNEWLKPGRQTVTTRLFIIEPDSASVSYFSASKLTLLNELVVTISVKVTDLTQRFVMIWFEFI